MARIEGSRLSRAGMLLALALPFAGCGDAATVEKVEKGLDAEAPRSPSANSLEPAREEPLAPIPAPAQEPPASTPVPHEEPTPVQDPKPVEEPKPVEDPKPVDEPKGGEMKLEDPVKGSGSLL